MQNKRNIKTVDVDINNLKNNNTLPKFTTGCGVDCGCHLRNRKIFKLGDLD